MVEQSPGWEERKATGRTKVEKITIDARKFLQSLQVVLAGKHEKNRAGVQSCKNLFILLIYNQLTRFESAQNCILCKSCKIVRFLCALICCKSVYKKFAHSCTLFFYKNDKYSFAKREEIIRKYISMPLAFWFFGKISPLRVMYLCTVNIENKGGAAILRPAGDVLKGETDPFTIVHASVSIIKATLKRGRIVFIAPLKRRVTVNNYQAAPGSCLCVGSN